ncbi:beta-lactamase family protein [Geomonas sp. Red875]|uniref:Beta-lactamase family protein n=1 Tax=Geomesophilobacter sediminis TaxID=2798584 RepID=A0A8J7LU52_9BACT|nr:beta-lactamase family protein [Geomesophilobacter sediminis]
MVYLLSATLLFASTEPTAGLAAQSPVNIGRSAPIDLILERAISRNLIAGGIVVVGNHDGIISTTARGRLNPFGSSPYIDERTIFDLASLTKVIATTPAVMKLLDEGKISLSDPLSRWFPEFRGSVWERVTILNLLTHTSGLDDISFANESLEGAIRKLAAMKHRSGSRFHYADINFILLGELVHRVSGETLDSFCRQWIFEPLGARRTMFLPPKSLAESIAPTTGYVSGVVQDPNARRLGGVAGHAGLFSSASDLALFGRLILGKGVVDGHRILSEEVVARMTSPYLADGGAVVRGLGWDMESPFSAPKGRFFSAASFGHTGYSGSSIWIDPQQDLFVVLLTNRLNYRQTRVFNQLRRDVSTLASAGFRRDDGRTELPEPWEMAQLTSELLQAAPPVVRAAAAHTPAQAARHKMHRSAHRGAKHSLVALKKGGAHRIARTARSEGVRKKRIVNRRV